MGGRRPTGESSAYTPGIDDSDGDVDDDDDVSTLISFEASSSSSSSGGSIAVRIDGVVPLFAVVAVRGDDDAAGSLRPSAGGWSSLMEPDRCICVTGASTSDEK